MKIHIVTRNGQMKAIPADDTVSYVLEDNPTISIANNVTIDFTACELGPYAYTLTERGLIVNYGEHQVTLLGAFSIPNSDIAVTLAFADKHIDVDLHDPFSDRDANPSSSVAEQALDAFNQKTQIDKKLSLDEDDEPQVAFSFSDETTPITPPANTASSTEAASPDSSSRDIPPAIDPPASPSRDIPPATDPPATPEIEDYSIDKQAAFAVNTERDGSQLNPDASVLADNSILMVWQSDTLDRSGYNIHAQRYSETGQALSPEFILNPVMLGDQIKPAIGAFPTGGFVAVWPTTSDDSSMVTQLQGQRFTNDGVALEPAFTIALDSADFNSHWYVQPPHVVTFADNSFMVAWPSKQVSGMNLTVNGQYFDASGEAVGDPISFTTDRGDSQQLIDVAVKGDQVQLIWHAFDSAGDSLGISGVRYDSHGQPIATDFLLATPDFNARTMSVDVTELNDGNFIVMTQESLSRRRGIKAHGQLFSPEGEALGEEFNILDEALWRNDGLEITALPDGGFMTVYSTGGTWPIPDQGIFAQRFSAAGEQLSDLPTQIIGIPVSDPAFLVNTVQPIDHALPPQITSLADGSIIVLRPDGNNNYNHAQRYDANGNLLGQQFQLLSNKFIFDGNEIISEEGTALGALDDGGFVVVFRAAASSQATSSYNDLDQSNGGIYAQRFNADGEQVGLGFLVNTEHNDYQGAPKIIGLDGGGFLVAWESHEQDGSGVGLYGQIYDQYTRPVGSEFLINQQQTLGDQVNVQLVTLAEGGFMAVWETLSEQGDAVGLWGQRFDADGQSLDAAPMAISQDNSLWQGAMSVSDRGDQGFIVVWETLTSDNTYDITAQVFNSQGETIGDNFIVNTDTEAQQRQPSATLLADDSYVVTWQSASPTFEGDIYAQRFDATGDPIDKQFIVNLDRAGNQASAEVTAMSDGGFMVVWEEVEANDYGYAVSNVYGQRFDASGNRIAHDVTSVDTDALAIDPVVDDVSDFVWLDDQEASVQVPQNLGIDAGESFSISQETLNNIGNALQGVLDPEQDLMTQLNSLVSFEKTDYGSIMHVNSPEPDGETSYAEIPDIDLTASNASAIEIIDAMLKNDLPIE